MKKEKADWGVALQMNWFDTSDSECYSYTHDIEYGPVGTCDHEGKATTDIETLGILVTVGPTVDMGSWKLYGGALYHLLTSDYNYTENETWEDTEGESGWWICKDSGDTETSSFGG
ncbi:MAG: hypothetical protein JW787_01185 [Sedimentisphaerales bacterium]|nr:hypothetical protein [Sedimentisphaerales bacterium]